MDHPDDRTDDAPIFPDTFNEPCDRCQRPALGGDLCPECEALEESYHLTGSW